MKKVFLFAVAAAALVACSNEELSTPEINPATSEAPVNFTVYTQRGLTRAGVAGTNDNTNIGDRGFGVFAYYTPGEQYDAKATPNFMYNQKVTKDGNDWKYEPVKYWPNEFGSEATSDEVDRISFFAYAPWTEVDPTTGNVVAVNEKDQKYNIISVNKNTATGDPMIKYVVDTDPSTSVDLLWGVAADDAATKYSGPIQQSSAVTITPGKPFIDLVKPAKPAEDLMSFNLKHALAKVKITIDYIDDKETPNGPAAGKINPDQTRIYVRNFKMTGFATKGTLNLNNNEGTAGEPLWKDFDGVKDLAFDEVVFQDGRKDGKEGETNGAQTNETPQGLNPNIVENYAVLQPATTGTPGTAATYKAVTAALMQGETYYTDAQGGGAFQATGNEDWQTTTYYEIDQPATAGTPGTPAKFGAGKTSGVTATPQFLFGGTGDPASATDGYFYIIPRNETSQSVDITIAYDVETIDPALAGKISDGETHGISIENVISKAKIFGDGVDFKAGNVYDIKIHLGMTSVKVSATVTDWASGQTFQVELPANQPANNNNQGQNP